MLRHAGVRLVTREDDAAGRWRVEMSEPPGQLPVLDFRVPGDFSSAAFLLVAGLLGLRAGAPLTIEGVGLNPTRTGLLPLLERMGGRVDVEGGEDSGEDGGEPVGNLTVGAAELHGIDVGATDVLSAIDEIPALVALAARAEGVTRVTGAGELRVKETDRLRALVEGLRALGVNAEELEDGLVVEGTKRPLMGVIDSRLDHRIAMAFGVLGALPGNDVRVEGAGSVDVSFPAFWETLARIGGGGGGGGTGGRPRSRGAASQPGGSQHGGPVITLDGPAGSGKSTTAREVARRLGFRHLDSGALYRALTLALLHDGIGPGDWSRLGEADLARHDIRLEPGEDERFYVLLDGRRLEDAALRRPDVTAQVSTVAGLPAVRAWLLGRQREAGRLGSLVADGRDMGTVVFPDADLKVFLVAELPERARRRLRDHEIAAPTPEEVAAEAARLEERDRRDSGRDISPLRRPDDAWDLDTTRLDFEAQVEAIVRELRARVSRPPGVDRAP
jgi:3-phosphoshikimate 1-carboxyvinyltransferase